jgi:hypothetical protein
MGSTGRKVIFAEFNEITWRVIDLLRRGGRLPTFAEFRREGAWGAPVADEEPPDLDPWISWTTVYTGRPRGEHGVRFLEQPPETVTGPRLADLAADAGLAVGVYGSIMHWPPRPQARGFWVPSTFAPGPETEPPDLRPIQELNLGQTRSHTPLAARGPGGLAWRTLQLARLGLRPATVARAAAALVRWKVRPHRAWEKVGFQPLVNLDFFENLYRRHRPEFATFHTNHAAHYMHRYWRAMDPAPFLTPPSPEEVCKYGPAVEFGYRLADRALRRLWNLTDRNTVLVLASALGQQPYVSEDFPGGRQVVRVKDIEALLEVCGVAGHAVATSMMAPQWNVRIADAARRAHAERVLRGAWVSTPGVPLFALETVGDTICLNIAQKSLKAFDPEAICAFPEAGDRRFRLGDFGSAQDATPKQGCHDRVGVVMLRGPGVRRGAEIGECSNLDLAPTVLRLLGLPVPSHMRGRVLEEALEGPARVAVPAAALV